MIKNSIKGKLILCFIIGILLLFISVIYVNFIVSDTSNSPIAAKNYSVMPIYNHGNFVYDRSISWNSSYTDIVNKYGTPDKIVSDYDSNEIRVYYESPKVVDYDFKYLYFKLEISTGRIIEIYLDSGSLYSADMPDETAKQLSETVKKALKVRHGQPNAIYDDSRLVWENIYAETTIVFFPIEYIDPLHSVAIKYYSTHDNSREKPYTDLPIDLFQGV